MLTLVSDQRNMSAPLSIMSSKFQNWLYIHWSNHLSGLIIVIPYIHLITFSTVYHNLHVYPSSTETFVLHTC